MLLQEARSRGDGFGGLGPACEGNARPRPQPGKIPAQSKFFYGMVNRNIRGCRRTLEVNMSRIYDATLVESERVSASRYLKLVQGRPEDIKSVRFVPPRIGTRGDFGSFVVEHTKALYAVKRRK